MGENYNYPPRSQLYCQLVSQCIGKLEVIYTVTYNRPVCFIPIGIKRHNMNIQRCVSLVFI